MPYYENPLHPPVHPSQISRYTTLDGASGITILPPTRRRLPQRSYIPTSKWDQAMGQNIRRHAAIQFDYIGYNGQGVQMRELASRSDAAIASMIEGADDPVFSRCERKGIAFRIIWPGYEHVEWYDQLELNPGGRPITRAKLGGFIARNFARFVEKTRKEPCNSEWNLAFESSGILFKDLVMVALVNVWPGVWQADVVIDHC